MPHKFEINKLIASLCIAVR